MFKFVGYNNKIIENNSLKAICDQLVEDPQYYSAIIDDTELYDLSKLSENNKKELSETICNWIDNTFYGHYKEEGYKDKDKVNTTYGIFYGYDLQKYFEYIYLGDEL